MAVMTQRTNMAPGLGKAFGEGLVSGYEQEVDRRELQNVLGNLEKDAAPQDVLKAILGSRARPEAKQEMFKNYLGAEEAQLKRESLKINAEKANKTAKKQYSANQLRSALSSLEEMEKIGAKGNLGIGSGVTKYFSSDIAKDFGKYEQLGKSLIAYASPIVIRNRKEFETLSQNIFDPTVQDAERAGILESMKKIIQDNLNEYEDLEKDVEDVQKVEERNKNKVHVKNKKTGTTGWVTPFEGMDKKYDKLAK